MEEARKKRTFFPEDTVNLDYSFHLCLLSNFGVVDCPKGVLHKIRQQADGLHKNKNPFIHIRDEGSLRGTTQVRQSVSCLLVSSSN